VEAVGSAGTFEWQSEEKNAADSKPLRAKEMMARRKQKLQDIERSVEEAKVEKVSRLEVKNEADSKPLSAKEMLARRKQKLQDIEHSRGKEHPGGEAVKEKRASLSVLVCSRRRGHHCQSLSAQGEEGIIVSPCLLKEKRASLSFLVCSRRRGDHCQSLSAQGEEGIIVSPCLLKEKRGSLSVLVCSRRRGDHCQSLSAQGEEGIIVSVSSSR
jgi:hypothetical protein